MLRYLALWTSGLVHTATNESDKSNFMSSRESREASSTTSPMPCLGCSQAGANSMVRAVVVRLEAAWKECTCHRLSAEFGVSPIGRHTASSGQQPSKLKGVCAVGTAGLRVDCEYMPRTDTIWSYLENGGWASIDTAPQNQDVYLVVTDNSGRPYCLPRPEVDIHGWMNSERSTPLRVTAVMWRAHHQQKRRKSIYEL
jgi:hypothetical protein